MLFSASVAPIQAVTKSDTLINAFKSYSLNASKDYQTRLQIASATFAPRVGAAQLRIENAITKLKNANQVTVLKLGNNRSYWGQFNCPLSRTDCIGVDKGPEFKVGEVTTIKNEVLTNLDQLYVMELILKDGLIELKQPEVYLSGVAEFRSSDNQLRTEQQTWDDTASKAKEIWLDSQDNLEAIRIAKLSAKRAGKSFGDFKKAFVAAFVFESNRVGLDKYASMPLSEINSLKALNNTIELTRLSSQADRIGASYTLNAALSFNRICSDLFTSEPSFKQDFKFVSQIYQKTFRTSLSLK